MKSLKPLVITIYVLMSLNLFSIENANLHFTQISTKDGLSQNTVRAIIEDKKGFIWAGTLDGLNRYDGYKIIVYKPQLGNPHSLIDHRIKDVFQDKDGYLWLKTYKNEFNCYDPVSDSFIDYAPAVDYENATYSNYYETAGGAVWLWGNSDGCLRISKNDKKFSATSFLGKKIPGNKKNCKFLFEDSKSGIWLGGESGLFQITENKTDNFYKTEYSFTNAVELNNKIYFTTEESCIIEYDIKRKSFQEIPCTKYKDVQMSLAKISGTELLIVTKSSGIITFNVNNRIFDKPQWAKDEQLKGNIEFITDKNQGIWIYNHTGVVWYYCQETQDVGKMELIPSDIAKIIDLERYNVWIDSKGLIWITTYGNGLFCYNPQNGELANYKYNANQNSPASDYLLSITEDHYGNIWVGSEYAGIIKVVKSNYEIRIVRPEKETSIGKNNNVRAIYGDNFNRIWVGTKNGSLYLYDAALTDGKCIYKDLNPYTMIEDLKNSIWVGTKGKGLYLIDLKTLRETAHFINSENNDNSLSNNTIFSLLRDNNGRMWIGTFGGGINFVEESSEGIIFKRFFFDDGNRSYIRCLYQDSKGKIWAGSSNGIICFNPGELLRDPKAYKSYLMNLNKNNSLNCNDIKTIYEDYNGEIWIGTAGGGLNKYIPPAGNEEEYFISYTKADGLAGDFVSGILEDEKHNLWISSESGITKFDRRDNSFTVYLFSEKTYGNNFNENANIYYQNGNMLWGSLDGLLIFNPESFLPDNNTPPVTFTNFIINHQKIETGEKDSPLHQSISYTGKMDLNYKQNTFTIEFATLVLKDPQRNKYTYMLENYDKQWNAISNLNTATYKNLPPGKYIFKVKGTNSDGVWNEETTQLKITINPPFWKSSYAYLIYGILILLALYIVFRLIYKFNTLNNNIKLEKELTNHKLRFFTNISHEFRTPLTLIRGVVENLNEQNDISERTRKQVNILSRNSAVLTRLIDQLLEFRKLQNNVLTLDLELTDMVGFSKEIHSSFQEMAEQKNMEYLFTCDTDSFDMFIDRRKVDKILYNLLSNAFKFTSKGGRIELVLTFDQVKSACLILVKDNGIGVEKDKQHLLFSRFMQIHFSSSGTGVGLSLVKEFVDVHKGKVWYESNQGQGSVFNVELSTNAEIYKGENFITLSHPAIEASNEILYTSDSIKNVPLPDIEDSALSNYKMLIIDDNDDIRNFLTEEFSQYFMVDTAEDGKQGLQKTLEVNPDLIICDVVMPEMDGFEVTRRLKEDFQTCHIPIILLTAHSSSDHQLEGIQSGADAYIMKPFSMKYLVTQVFKLIEQREQLKKRFSNEYVLDGNLITTIDKDKEFYNLINKILEKQISDSQFSVDKFAELAKLRRTIFYKKVKGITGLSPNELIKVKRLRLAAELLLQGELTVSEISYKVGFEDPFYFSKCFKAQYNCSPSKYGQPFRSQELESRN